METQTRRQKMVALLSDREYGWSLRQLSEALGVENPRLLVEDLEQIQKTLEKENRTLEVEPAQCRLCGWASDRKIKSPSKCPNCHAQRFEPARFRIPKVNQHGL